MPENELLENLLQLLTSYAEESEEGFTTREVSAMLGVGENTARNHIRQLLEEGKVMPVRIRRETMTGISQRVPGYKIVV